MTVILAAPCLQTYVMSRAVTEQTVTQSRRLVEFSVSKWLKFTQFHLFTPSLIGKRNFTMGKPTRSTKKKPAFTFVRFEIESVYTIIAGLPWKFLNFDGVLRRLHSVTQANSQVCFKWMSKCVIYITLREFGVIPHVKCCRRKWVTKLNFSYPENLSLIFELFQYDELRYCPESIF